MKVMGSSVLAFEIIVLGLVMPVAHVVYDYPLGRVVWMTVGLMVLCVLGIGAMRRDRRTAIITGSLIQLLVFLTGIIMTPFLVPAVLFGVIWVLAIVLSSKVDAAKAETAGKSNEL